MNGRKGKSKALIAGGITLLLLILLPLFKTIGSNYIVNLFFVLFIFITLSQSWNLVGGYTGQFNLGLAAYFGSGALAFSLLSSAGFSYYLAIVAGGVAAALLACVIGIPTLRLRGVYFSIGTLALAEALRITVSSVWPSSTLVPPEYFEKYSMAEMYYLSLALAVLTVALVYTVVNSKIGLALRAIRDEEEAARACGVSPAQHKIMVFVLSSFLIGLAGGLYGYQQGIITPGHQFMPEWNFGPLVAACIGGLGTIVGPLLGSAIFVLLQELFSQTLGKAHFIITGLFFIIVVLFLPRGLVQSGLLIRRLVKGSVRGKQERATDTGRGKA
jgi:branched-chain amino acid transport system permease protein